MAIDDKPVGFNQSGARRIIRATKIVENQYRNRPLAGGRYSGPGTGVVPAVVATGGISARSGSTMGSGNVTLQDMTEGGVVTSTGVTLKCWNKGGAVAAGAEVLVSFGTRGPWVVVVPCS